MMRQFCTFFDNRFIPLGLALYRSLEIHCPDFMLWVLCVDDITYDLLKRLNCDKIVSVRMAEFETPELLSIKGQPGRNYLGTCKSAFIVYVFKKNPQIDILTYLDSDIYFLSSPESMFEELGQDNVLIVPHDLAPEKKIHEERSGKFNAGIIMFKNNNIGLSCLKYWRERCFNWCENRCLSDRYGDQKYFDEWPKKFPGVHILKNIGAKIGPWNVNQYKLKKTGRLYLVDGYPIILYHFSSLRIYSPNKFFPVLHSYRINRTVRKIIYKPYIRELKKIIKSLALLDPPFTPGFWKNPGFWKTSLNNIKFDLISVHIYLKKKLPFYSGLFYKYLKKKKALPS